MLETQGWRDYALLDSGEAANLLYAVMPFVEGESLRGRLTREKQLPVEDALAIGGLLGVNLARRREAWSDAPACGFAGAVAWLIVPSSMPICAAATMNGSEVACSSAATAVGGEGRCGRAMETGNSFRLWELG